MRNFLKYRLYGLNIDKLIGQFIKKNISLYNVKRINHKKIEFAILSRDYSEFLSIVKMFNIKTKLVTRLGFLSMVDGMFKRVGIVIGLVVSFAIAFSISGLTMKTDIYCENPIARAEVEQIVNTSRNSSAKSIEKEIYNKVNNVKNVNVYRNGVYLIVYVYFEDLIREKNYNDIIATASGVIKEINVSSGVAKVKVGDVVKKGDVLITSKTDAAGNKSEVGGDVTARVWITGSYVFCTTKFVFERTGRQITQKYLEFFGKTFTIKEKDNPYYLYEKLLNEAFISKNNFLPIKKVTVTLFEVVQKEVDVTIDEPSLKQKAYDNAVSKLGGASETGVTYSITAEGNYIKADAYIETVQNIAAILK